MEKYPAEDTSAVKQDKKNVLLTGKDPNLSHLFGEEPKTPSSMPTAADVSGESVMEDSGQFHKDESGEPEYRLFEEQSYVPDFSPANQMVIDNSGSSFQSATETAGPSTSKTRKNLSQRKLATRSNGGSVKVKPFPCKEPGCRKSFCNFRVLQKHMQRIHSNDTNNNSLAVTQKMPDTKRVQLPSESGVTSTDDMTTAVQQVYPTVEQPANYSKRTSILGSDGSSGRFNGPVASVTVDANSVRDENIESKVNDAGFVEGGDANLFNTQLLAQSTSQNVLQNQQFQSDTGTQQAVPSFRPHQSSRALQQIAMGVQMRSSQYSAPQQAMSTMTATTIPTTSAKQQFMPMQGPITGVRAQLRKSLSSSGKLENVNAMCREWPRVQIPIGGSLDSGMSHNFFQMRMHEENDSSDVDNAPLLKNLLARTKTRLATSSGDGTFAQDNGQLSTGYPPLLDNWTPETQPQGDLRSPILVAKRNEFQYHATMSDIPKLDQSPNPSPLHSPTYANAPQFTMQQHSQTTPLSQHSEQQFFPDDIMVSNDNNQQMDDSSNESLNEMIIESESLVQDLIDEAEASSNQGKPAQASSNQFSQVQQQLIPYADQTMNPTGQVSVQGRVTPPPAYNLDQNVAVMNAELIQNDASTRAVQMYMAQNQVKAEPQSPMIMSPMAQRSFFSSQGNAIGVLSTGNMQPLASPTTPHHQVPLQPGMQPHTPVGEAQWQFPISGQNQNYGSVPQSPVTLVAPINMVQLSGQPTQDSIVQNINYLPPSRQTTTGNPKPARIRRSSSGAARKNADGTLSCAICDHSFRSVPALNGHMRVHSSSTDKKSKDEKQRKGSGSSTGGNESRTPQSLSSPTTPTFNKINPSASMYQNTAAYNSVTVPAYSNPGVLYNPTPNAMDVNPRDRINTQAGLYPYALSHPGPMQPHDALLAAADLIARSEPEFAMFMRSPGREDFSRTGGDLAQAPDLQHYLGSQQGGGANTELSAAYRNTPTSGVILVTHPQNPGVPSYMVRQTDGVQASGAPLVPFVPLQAQGIPGTRQFYANSPLLEQHQSNPPALDTIQYIQQPSNRSTPLADFADIVVLHDQGQLFTNNQMLVAPFGVAQNHQTRENMQQIQHQSHRQQGEQIQLSDSAADASMLGSVKNYLWAPESQQHHTNMTKVEESVIKEEDFLSSQLQKSERQVNQQNPSDPFIFPVTVPVHYLRDESTAVTSTFHNIFRQNHHNDAFSHNMSSFHDDPLVQESINVANPSTILPNSMMGGNPSGFRSFRQRHHSEGSILKKTWQAEAPNKDDVKPYIKTDISGSMPPGARTPPEPLHSTLVTGQNSQVLAHTKRKVENRSPKLDNKRIKTENRTETQPMQQAVNQVADTKKEVWTVPKSAPPNRQRHRRHSADSRLTYRSGTLFSRSAYLQSMQMASKGLPGRGSRGTGDSRVKRRPPPLIIPASVNTLGNTAYQNGSLFISQLHQRRRPSVDSGSSCGNEKIPPYTPPPMLSPARFGTGLYRNTPGTPSLKPMMFRQVSCEHTNTIITTIPEEEPEDDFVRSADPKINIGADYQAELPNMCPRWRLERESHKAEPVWKPMEEIQTDNSTQSRHVEEYLKLACSAAVPYGGCNKEFALHLLYENKGDILACVRELLSTKVTVSFDHWMSSYTYMGSVRWSLKERQDFERAMMQYHKDFYQISKLVETKTTAACVDYYYHTIKRRRRRIQRPRRFRRDSEEENTSFGHSPNDVEELHSDENDFLHDHVPIRREPEIFVQTQIHEEEHERKTSEVVRRSPPSTAFIRAPPQVDRVVSVISQPTPPSIISFNSAAAQHIPEMHSYAKQPINIQTLQHQQPTAPPPLICNYSQYPITCKVPNCNQTFPTMQQLLQHRQTHKTLKPYFDRLNQATPSPASSPGSVNSAEPEAPQFQCPRCGKTFSKVKSRNAHMKTHGKLAQEKRRQKEEEARRKLEEAATWRNRAQQQQQQRHRVVISPSGKARKLIQFQTVQSPLTKPPGM